MELLQHVFHNDHGEWALLVSALSGGFTLSAVARTVQGWWRWLWCKCPQNLREFSEVSTDAQYGEWHYSRCSTCSRTWLHFRDWCTRVSTSNPVLKTKVWSRS